MHFDHVGIATDDADPLLALYADLLDADLAHEESFDGLRVAFLDLDGAYLELLEPLPDAEGAIPRYLEREGPGIHHVAVATDDIEATLARAESLGVEAVDESPRAGAWGHEVAFLHPASTGGVLVEFVQH